MAELSWLGVVRHGESTANVAAEFAEAAGLAALDITERDADVPLSATGAAQAGALRAWLAGLPVDQRPEVVLSSPYRRAVQTAELTIGDLDLPVRLDERLRDRELGVIDLLTRYGVKQRYPEEAVRRARLGPFYYRPPGGEAWTDVALRLRGVLGDLRRDHPDRRVLLFAHEAVVFLLRYLIEDLTEAEVRDLSAARLHNASVTAWTRVDGRLRLATFNDITHVTEAGAQVTRQTHV
ncbi:MAG: histidine phosphatase family protein [Actinobacteria bacterium]|nr:MAG: histidine phosphatase family protein [Actinomycetota bacterium]